MKVEDVKPGMKGYAVTVFSGEQSDRFEIEVVDVVRDYLPKQDAILFRSPDPRMQHSGIVGGMSGSPIYIDGKLAERNLDIEYRTTIPVGPHVITVSHPVLGELKKDIVINEGESSLLFDFKKMEVVAN